MANASNKQITNQATTPKVNGQPQNQPQNQSQNQSQQTESNNSLQINEQQPEKIIFPSQ
jgi:hypothetical protein